MRNLCSPENRKTELSFQHVCLYVRRPGIAVNPRARSKFERAPENSISINSCKADKQVGQVPKMRVPVGCILEAPRKQQTWGICSAHRYIYMCVWER